MSSSARPAVSVKPRVSIWKLVQTEDGFTHYEPTLECGHVHYGPYYASGSLPLNLDCYPCTDRAMAAVLGDSSGA